VPLSRKADGERLRGKKQKVECSRTTNLWFLEFPSLPGTALSAQAQRSELAAAAKAARAATKEAAVLEASAAQDRVDSLVAQVTAFLFRKRCCCALRS
jgi:hypothetical protein